MEYSSALNYLGISGGSLAIISTVIYLLRKTISSKCVRNRDGRTVIELGLNTDEIQSIQSNPQLKDMFDQLKNELKKQVIPTPTNSAISPRSTPSLSVPV